MDDCILSSLSLPPGAKPVIDSASSPPVTDCSPSELRGRAEAPSNGGGPQRLSRRGPEAARQRQQLAGDSADSRLHPAGRSVSRETKRPCDETIDLTTSGETTDSESVAEDSSRSARGGRPLRKRKLSEEVEIPAKQAAQAAFL